jgi:hypothetical protein
MRDYIRKCLYKLGVAWMIYVALLVTIVLIF